MIAQNWTDSFEHSQLIIASGGKQNTVLECSIQLTQHQIAASTFSNRISLDQAALSKFLKPWVSPRPHTTREGDLLPSLELYRLMQIPAWSRSPATHIQEMRDTYRQVNIDHAMLSGRIAKLLPTLKSVDSPSKQPVGEDVDKLAEELAHKCNISLYKLCAQFQAACTLLLAVAIFLNATIRAVDDPFDQEKDLAANATRLTEELIQLVEDMLPLRPLDSSGITMTFVVAWGADHDAERRKRLEQLMAEHQFESIGGEWVSGGLWWQNYLSQLRDDALRAAAISEGEELSREKLVRPDIFVQAGSEYPVGRCIIL